MFWSPQNLFYVSSPRHFSFRFFPPISNPKIFHSQNCQCQCKILISIKWFGWFSKRISVWCNTLEDFFEECLIQWLEFWLKSTKKEISSNQIAYYSTNLFALRIVEFYHNFFCTSLYMLRIKYTEHWLSYIFLETRREKKIHTSPDYFKTNKKAKKQTHTRDSSRFQFQVGYPN